MRSRIEAQERLFLRGHVTSLVTNSITLFYGENEMEDEAIDLSMV